MYESPINIVQKVDEIESSFSEVLDNYVMSVVRSYGVDVDKEELVKALKYDREQYDKGFKDGFDKGVEDEKIGSWCRANCIPGPSCPDTYCIEAREGALGKEEK